MSVPIDKSGRGTFVNTVWPDVPPGNDLQNKKLQNVRRTGILQNQYRTYRSEKSEK
jgi:hypothetical protein